MELRSLLSRMSYSKIAFSVFIISLVWTVALFLAPATLAPGEVTDLEGRANALDFQDKWAELPPFQHAVYLIGDIECHQISNRTLYINGNQMPVCARDTGVFLFATIGLLVALVIRPYPSASRMFISMLPQGARSFIQTKVGELKFMIIVLVLFLAPLALDGGVQLLTDYESSNSMRFLTGALAGFMGGFLFAALLVSTKYVMLSDRQRSGE